MDIQKTPLKADQENGDNDEQTVESIHEVDDDDDDTGHDDFNDAEYGREQTTSDGNEQKRQAMVHEFSYQEEGLGPETSLKREPPYQQVFPSYDQNEEGHPHQENAQESQTFENEKPVQYFKKQQQIHKKQQLLQKIQQKKQQLKQKKQQQQQQQQSGNPLPHSQNVNYHLNHKEAFLNKARDERYKATQGISYDDDDDDDAERRIIDPPVQYALYPIAKAKKKPSLQWPRASETLQKTVSPYTRPESVHPSYANLERIMCSTGSVGESHLNDEQPFHQNERLPFSQNVMVGTITAQQQQQQQHPTSSSVPMGMVPFYMPSAPPHSEPTTQPSSPRTKKNEEERKRKTCMVCGFDAPQENGSVIQTGCCDRLIHWSCVFEKAFWIIKSAVPGSTTLSKHADRIMIRPADRDNSPEALASVEGPHPYGTPIEIVCPLCTWPDETRMIDAQRQQQRHLETAAEEKAESLPRKGASLWQRIQKTAGASSPATAIKMIRTLGKDPDTAYDRLIDESGVTLEQMLKAGYRLSTLFRYLGAKGAESLQRGGFTVSMLPHLQDQVISLVEDFSIDAQELIDRFGITIDIISRMNLSARVLAVLGFTAHKLCLMGLSKHHINRMHLSPYEWTNALAFSRVHVIMLGITGDDLALSLDSPGEENIWVDFFNNRRYMITPGARNQILSFQRRHTTIYEHTWNIASFHSALDLTQSEANALGLDRSAQRQRDFILSILERNLVRPTSNAFSSTHAQTSLNRNSVRFF